MHCTAHNGSSRSSTGGDSTSDAHDAGSDDAASGVCTGRELELQYTS